MVQSILDTYPLGFPAAAAQQQVDWVIGALLAMGPEAEAMSDLLLPYCFVMSGLADAGLHDVAGDRFSEFVSALQQQDLRHGAMLDVLAAVAGDEPDVSEYLLRDSDFDPEFATLRQARAIITTARRQGLDSVKLSKLAAAMGHEAEELGVTPPSTDYATVSILLEEAVLPDSPTRPLTAFTRPLTRTGMKKSNTSRLRICGSSVRKTPTGRWTDCRDSTVSFPAEALLFRC